MGMKHWWWRTRVSHCSNIMASLFIHEMAAIIWDSCDDFYHCNEFFNCPCNSCHQKIIFQNKEKTFKAWKNFSRLCHTAQIVLNLYNITFSKPWSRIPFTEKIKLYIAKLSTTLTRFQGGNCWSSSYFDIRYWKLLLKSNIEYYYWTLKYVVHPSSISQDVGKVLVAGGYWPLSTCLIFLLNGIGTHEHALQRNTHDICVM